MEHQCNLIEVLKIIDYMGTIRLNINSETAITENNVPAQSWNSQRMKKEKTKKQW